MSLYRQYRPQTFAEVIGQEHVVTTLENAVSQDKLAHAYLFAGSRGTGKTSVARILAKHILTRGMADEVLQKQIFKGVEEGSLVDLMEIDAASNRGIDDIRMLVEKIQFSPVAAAAKVYIIDEVHMLTREAFNALLKTLEEPPSYAYFILATTELQKIPATIQSRCQRFVFRHIADEDMVRALQKIADQEHITIDRTALRLIAQHARGGMRDAISLLDQLRTLPQIDIAAVQERTGAAGREYAETLFVAVMEKNAQQILDTVRAAEDAGIAMDALARDMLAIVRAELQQCISDNRDITPLQRILALLLDAVKHMRISPLPGLVLESALLELSTGGSPPSPSEQSISPPRTSRIASMLSKKEAPHPEQIQEGKTAMEVSGNGLVEAPDFTLQTVRDAWPQILKEAKPPSVKMSLKTGRVVSVEHDTVIVSYPSRFHRDRVQQLEARHSIEDALQRIFKRTMHLQNVVDEERHTEKERMEPEVDLAQAAAEVF